jgi:hypothetical protein
MDTATDEAIPARLLGRYYTEEVFNRSTGELETISLGHWVTVTELGELHGVGRLQVRSILRQLDFLGVEGGGRYQRHRITRWAVDRGYGKRIECSARVMRPFDVISPAGRAWIDERWSATEEAVCWLIDHFDKLSQEQIGEILDVSRQLVSRYQNTRSKQIRDVREGKRAVLPDEGKGSTSFPRWFVEVDNTSPQQL